jgi:hypothetical protein
LRNFPEEWLKYILRKLAACINKAIVNKDLMVGDDGTITTTDFIELDI